MNQGEIHGVRVLPLKTIPGDQGSVMHMLRRDAGHFQGFGEVYFSTVLQGAVKAWKRHREMTLSLAVPVGRVRFVLFDDRPDSPTKGLAQVVEIGQGNYALLQVPPGVWNGFTGLAPGESFICNCANLPHDPGEVDRLAPDDPSMPNAWEEA